MRKSLYRRHNQVFLDLLRRYREQGKLRQRDLALNLGSVQGTVSKAETGNRRLDVIELREWLLAIGVDFLEFMTELHEQLESVDHTDPWPIGRLPFQGVDSTPPSGIREQPTQSGPTDGGSLLPAAELAVLLSELDRVRNRFHSDVGSAESRHNDAVRSLNAYLTDLWVPAVLCQWQASRNGN